MNRASPTRVPSVPELAGTLLAAIEHAGLGLAIVMQGADQVRSIYRSPRLASLTGDSDDEPSDPLAAIVPSGRACLDEQLAAGDATPRHFQTALRHKGGHEVPVELTASAVPTDAGVAVMVFVRDLSERERIEQAMRESEARFRSLAEASPDSITVIGGGRMLYANQAAAAGLGFATPAELMARPVDQLLCDDDEAVAMAERVQRLARGERLPPREYAGRCKDGSVAVVEISTSWVAFDGEPACLGFGRDTRERRALHAELLRSDRLATLGMLAASVAHEINNPLTYVLINLERMAAMVPPLIADPEQRRQIELMLGDAREGGERVRTIVRDLLTMARHEHAVGPVAVERAVDTALKLAGPTIASRARIIRRGEPVPPVRGNTARLSQVFLNLVLNAADAFDAPDDRNQVIVEVGRDGGEVVVTISDNAAGLSPDLLDRIFEPLFTTKAVGAGTGLGLSICKSIVTELGGTVAARSEPGRGTAMVVRLPVVDPEASHDGDRAAPGTRRRLRVAVIDDDVRLADAVVALVQLQHHAEVFHDAATALAVLCAEPAFDHVLCDLNMPGLAGAELYLQLRACRPEYRGRITFISGGSPPPEIEALVAAGDAGFLAKPFDRDLLLAALAR